MALQLKNDGHKIELAKENKNVSIQAVAYAVSILVLAPALALGDMPFEDVHFVKKAKVSRGYRGNNGDLLQMKDGSVLFCYTEYGESGRIMAKKSSDEGNSFLHQRNIARDPKNDYGYQCVEFIGDDLALIAYHANDGLHVARIAVEWFYGK